MTQQVTPYNQTSSSKKTQVGKMFDNIAGSYDFLNHFFSAGIDILWRKKAVRILKREHQGEFDKILDAATGTGDFAIEALKADPGHVIGIDISTGMLEEGRKKLKKKKLDNRITLQEGDAENLEFPDNYFDGLVVGYGVRNYEDLEQGLSEMFRVLKPGGVCVILEFSRPHRFPLKQLFNFYFNRILPFLGRLISKDQHAYTYLPESVRSFPEGNNFTEILKKTGYKETQWIPLTFGISSIYLGKK